MYTPTIGFSDYNEQNDASPDNLLNLLAEALTESGFLKIVNLGIAQAQIDCAFELSRWFFAHPEEENYPLPT